MGRVNTYLNFAGDAEEAFTVYAGIFGSQVVGLTRFGDHDAMTELNEEDRHKILHVELPVLNGHVLMGTDALASMGQSVRVGNNTTISLEVDSRDEADRLYDELSAGGGECSAMQQMFFGYWGTSLDRFGIRWMINYRAEL